MLRRTFGNKKHGAEPTAFQNGGINVNSFECDGAAHSNWSNSSHTQSGFGMPHFSITTQVTIENCAWWSVKNYVLLLDNNLLYNSEGINAEWRLPS